MFVVCLFRALYQGTDKTLDFTKSMVRMQKLLGCIDKLRTLVEGEWGGDVHQKAYRNLCLVMSKVWFCLTLLPIKHLEKALCHVIFSPFLCIQPICLDPLP